jgi:hypothetical protein
MSRLPAAGAPATGAPPHALRLVLVRPPTRLPTPASAERQRLHAVDDRSMVHPMAYAPRNATAQEWDDPNETIVIATILPSRRGRPQTKGRFGRSTRSA